MREAPTMKPTVPHAPRFSPSVTVAAVIERDGRYLLVEEHTSDGLRLNNPAGHLEQGESPEQGVVREAVEETTCDFTPTALVGMYLSRALRAGKGTDVTYLRLAYTGHAGEPQAQRQLDTGIVRTLWMTIDEVRASVARHRSPLVLRCIEDHAAGVRWPLAVVHSDPSLWNPPVVGMPPARD
jgi:8-oxo-dGTP pyrophosphatase MutT (NUDIX family)